MEKVAHLASVGQQYTESSQLMLHYLEVGVDGEDQLSVKDAVGRCRDVEGKYCQHRLPEKCYLPSY